MVTTELMCLMVILAHVCDALMCVRVTLALNGDADSSTHVYDSDSMCVMLTPALNGDGDSSTRVCDSDSSTHCEWLIRQPEKLVYCDNCGSPSTWTILTVALSPAFM